MMEQAMKHGAVETIPRAAKTLHGSGGFRIEILWPGTALGRKDSGIGTIGRIDHARVQPGTLVKMHPHRDDEILTYIRTGRVEHKDTVGDVETITATRLMLMGAGAEFQHEELVDPGGETLTALQIFLRPRAGGLDPQVQFHDFDAVISENAWRRIAGPDATDPLQIRSRTWVDDGRFDAGRSTDLSPAPGLTRLLYVFDGHVAVDDHALRTGEAALLMPDAARIEIHERSDLVLLTTDERAAVFDGGMFSGNTQSDPK